MFTGGRVNVKLYVINCNQQSGWLNRAYSPGVCTKRLHNRAEH